MPELEQLAAEDSLDEQISGHLMAALYHSGRQADALAAYQRLPIPAQLPHAAPDFVGPAGGLASQVRDEISSA